MTVVCGDSHTAHTVHLVLLHMGLVPRRSNMFCYPDLNPKEIKKYESRDYRFIAAGCWQKILQWLLLVRQEQLEERVT